MRLSTWAVVLLPAVLAAPVRNAESISTMEAESSALQAPDEKPAQTVGGDCVPRESFIPIWFENSTLVRSNLGGMGGRCHIPGACAELLSTDTPHEIYIEDIAVSASGDRVDLRITNQSEYRVWNAYWNGIKDPLKEFGVVHLLGPRQVDQGDSWDTAFTFVQLRFAFINHDSGAPETLSRTYVTFYDFDTGRGRFDGAMASVEMMQMGPEANSFVRAPHTELLNVSGWRSELDDTSYASFEKHSAGLDSPPWSNTVIAASTYGIGKDNPLGSYNVTGLQAARSVMYHFDNVDTFSVRFAINRCCTTGRNFLFAGYSKLSSPLCPPAPSPPSPPPFGITTIDEDGQPDEPEELQCDLYGDPHVRTWSDFKCGLFGLGLFPLLSLPGYSAQGFFCPPPRQLRPDTIDSFKKTKMSYIVGVAVKIGDDIVTVVNGAVTGNTAAVPSVPQGTGNGETQVGALTVSHKSNDGTFHCAIKTSSGKLAMKVVSLPDDKSATGYLQGVHAFTDPITDLRCHGIQNTCAALKDGYEIGSVEKQGLTPLFSATDIAQMTEACGGELGLLDDEVTCGAQASACNVCAATGLSCDTARSTCEAACPCAPADYIEDCMYDYCVEGGSTAATLACADEYPCPAEAAA